MSLSVRDLLDDQMFKGDVEEDETALNQSLLMQSYNDCTKMFIRNDFKECLEKMYSSHLLEDDVLYHDKKLFALYLNVLDSVGDFQELGVSLQKVILRMFETSSMDTMIKKVSVLSVGDSVNGRIDILNRLFRIYYKTITLKRLDKLEDIVVLQDNVKFEISQHLEHMSNQDKLEHVITYYELIKFYIFKVQVALLKEEKSINIYESLCKSVPGIKPLLREHNIMESTTLEDELIKGLTFRKLEQIPENISSSSVNSPAVGTAAKLQKHIEQSIGNISKEINNNNNDEINNSMSLKTLVNTIKEFKGHYHQMMKSIKNSPIWTLPNALPVIIAIVLILFFQRKNLQLAKMRHFFSKLLEIIESLSSHLINAINVLSSV